MRQVDDACLRTRETADGTPPGRPIRVPATWPPSGDRRVGLLRLDRLRLGEVEW